MASLDGKLEPETKDMDERAPLYSIAISLKRIADELTGGGERLGVVDSIFEASTRTQNR